MRKYVFPKYAKLSAATASLTGHALFILISCSFVAVAVIQKDIVDFESKPVSYPKLSLRKLQVPVNYKKSAQQPRRAKQLSAPPKITITTSDLRIPEIVGIRSNPRSYAGGSGSRFSLGYSIPEIELFGIKSKGEKVFLILDASAFMMEDEIGGIPAYSIIKAELVRILEGLNSSILFNIAIYDSQGEGYVLFPHLVQASGNHVAMVKEWLEPLNAVWKGMGDEDYGTKTLGAGGIRIRVATQVDPLKSEIGWWCRPAMLAMEQQADVIYLLTCRWGHLKYSVKDLNNWSESEWKQWNRMVAKAQDKHEEENEIRRKRGKPPRVIGGGDRRLVRAYFPSYRPLPKRFELVAYEAKEIFDAFRNKRTMSRSRGMREINSIFKKPKEDTFSLHVIHFVEKDRDRGEDASFKKIASLSRSQYRQIKGLGAIRSYMSSRKLAKVEPAYTGFHDGFVHQPYKVGVVTGPVEAAPDAHYYYYVPTSLKSGRKLPLLFYTHWNGANPRLLQEIVEGAELCRWVLAISVESRNKNSSENNTESCEEAVDHILKTLPIGKDRLYFTGNSGGGAQTFFNYHQLRGYGVMPCAGYVPEEVSAPSCDSFIINGAWDYNRYASACARSEIGSSAAHRFYVGGHQSKPGAWLKIEGMVWLEGHYLSRKGKKHPDVQQDYENSVLKWIEKLRKDEPHRAYYWAVFLKEELKLSKDNASWVEELIRMLGADRRNQLYAEGLKEIDEFSVKVLSGFGPASLYGHTDPLIISKCESMLRKYTGVPVIEELLKAFCKPTTIPER